MIKRTVVLAVSTQLMLSACAPKASRDAARYVALSVQSVQKDTEEFKRFRDTLAKARLSTMDALELEALKAEQKIQKELLVRRLAGDEHRATLFEGLRKGTEAVEKQRLDLAKMQTEQAKTENAARSAVAFQQAKLGETAFSLSDLAEKRPMKEELEFFGTFFKEVHDEMEKLKVESQSRADKTSETIAGKTAQTKNTATGEEK